MSFQIEHEKNKKSIIMKNAQNVKRVANNNV